MKNWVKWCIWMHTYVSMSPMHSMIGFYVGIILSNYFPSILFVGNSEIRVRGQIQEEIQKKEKREKLRQKKTSPMEGPPWEWIPRWHAQGGGDHFVAKSKNFLSSRKILKFKFKWESKKGKKASTLGDQASKQGKREKGWRRIGKRIQQAWTSKMGSASHARPCGGPLWWENCNKSSLWRSGAKLEVLVQQVNQD